MLASLPRFVVAGLLLGAALPSAAASAAEDAVGVSSDGREFHGRASAKRFVPSFEGLGRRTEADAAARLPADAAVPDSADEIWRLWSLKPATAPIGTESIIGPDDRKRVRNTARFPNSAVVLVTFEDQRCTGWMIGPDTVATAGHCVHSGGRNGRWYQTGSYRVYAGRDGARKPFGSCRARTLFSNTGWTERGSAEFDYGAIKLNCKIGNRTGTFGFAWIPGSMDGAAITVAGYPGDKPLNQWTDDGRIELTRTRELFYANDTFGGQSGAPVYTDRKGCGVCGIAVHAYGLYGRHPYNRYNHGVRITKAVFQQFEQWVAD